MRCSGAALGLLLFTACRAPAGVSPPPPPTAGETALALLDEQIEGSTRVAAHPGALMARCAAVSLLLTRARLRGRVSDLEAADALAQGAGDTTDGLLASADTALALHRFAEARRLLDEVDRRDPRRVTEARRITLLGAIGDRDEAIALARARLARVPNAETKAGLAVLLVDDAPGDALQLLADVRSESTFFEAWLHLLRGRALAKQGDAAAAIAAFTKAAELVPGYAEAISRRAALEPSPEAAIEGLKPLAAASDDPTYAGDLAALFALLHDPETALWRERARTGFEALLARHPEAYADHAARFFLSSGNVERARPLAELNASLRHTPDALALRARTRRFAGP